MHKVVPETCPKRIKLLTFWLFQRSKKVNLLLPCPLDQLRNGHSKFGTVDPSIIKTIFETTEADILQAPCALEEDRKKILAFLQGGHKGLGVQRLQLRLQRWSAFHLALVLAGNRDDPLLLQKILSIPGFSIHSEFAKGALGESALHKAVAGNRLRTVEMLLDLGLSPNSTDAMQETPLHYAVLAGDAAMVDLLIARKADPIMESTFGETALEVAAQNAAAFLGHESAPLARQLEEAEQRAFLESESASFPSISPSSTFGV